MRRVAKAIIYVVPTARYEKEILETTAPRLDVNQDYTVAVTCRYQMPVNRLF
jgi:hypothetical protein